MNPQETPTAHYEPYDKNSINETTSIRLNSVLLDGIFKGEECTMELLANIAQESPPTERELFHVGRWFMQAVRDHANLTEHMLKHFEYHLHYHKMIIRFKDYSKYEDELHKLFYHLQELQIEEKVEMGEFVREFLMPAASEPMVFAVIATFITFHSQALGMAGMLKEDEGEEAADETA